MPDTSWGRRPVAHQHHNAALPCGGRRKSCHTLPVLRCAAIFYPRVLTARIFTHTANFGGAEMLSIASLDSNVVDFRIGSFVSQELEKWLCDRTFRQRQVDLDAFIRGHIGPEETYKADLTYATSPMRKAGDIFIARPSMGRYTGELQIARTDLPADENFATVARVADCDLPLLETYRDRRNFRLLKA